MAPTRSASARLTFVALVAAALLLLASAAGAETVMVQGRTRLKSRPSPEADTVLRVRDDRPARVLRRGGGWIKVRIGEEVGWVPRSHIQEEDADDEDADDHAPEAAVAERDGGDDDDGTDADEDTDDPEVAEDDEEPAAEVAEKDSARAPAGPRFAASAALGLRSLSSTFTSDGAMELASYRLSARSYSAGVAFDAVAYRSGSLLGMLDARYAGSVASPGVQFATSEAGTGYVPFTTHDVDLGARVGWSFGWLRATARAGYHGDILHVEKVDNVGRMPSEVLTGGTIGAALEAPFTGSGWSGRAAIDRLVGGKRKQTAGLEDGAPARAGATWTTLAIGYALSAAVSAELGYRRATASSSWSGASAREPDVSSASRTDVVQQLTLGLAQSF